MAEQTDWTKPPPPTDLIPSGTQPFRYTSWWTIIALALLFLASLVLGFIGSVFFHGSLGMSIAPFIPAPIFLFVRSPWLIANIRRYPKDDVLTERLHEKMPSTKYEVHVDRSMQAFQKPYIVRKRNRILVAQRVLDYFTADQVDFLIVRTALDNKNLYLWAIFAFCGYITGLAWLKPMVSIAGFSLLIATLIISAIFIFTRASTTVRALEITRDLDAALATTPALSVIDTGAVNATDAKRYQAKLIKKGQELGLPTSTWKDPAALD